MATVWRVLAWNAVEQRWRIRNTYDTPAEAAEKAEAMQHHDPRVRVRVMPGVKPPAVSIKPLVNNATRAWRLSQAGRMSDLADTNKRYKSPG